MILGNVLCVNMPRTDYGETDPAKASYLVNRPAADIDDAKSKANAALPRTGGTMTGDIAMEGSRVTGLAAPADSADAATKAYVDGRRAAATATLTAGDWAENLQTVAAQGVTAANHILITPAPDSYVAYAEAVVYCTAQGEGTLTFTCGEVPEADLTVNILIMN